MDHEELDALLQVMENPVRRKIIRRLAQEPGYALQLSKELGLGQPLVAKHLAIMEEAGLITSTSEESPSGPRRRRYSLSRSVSITMDVGPNMFIERGMNIDAQRAGSSKQTASQLLGRVDETMSRGKDSEKLSRLAEILEEVDSKMRQMEDERMALLAVRNRAMHEAAMIATKLELDKRRVLFHILDEHDRTADSISESLNLRELTVRKILEELQNEFFD